MSGRIARLAVGLAAGALLLPATAAAHNPAARVNAEGNAFTGGLQFSPADVTVDVGDGVEWTNTDTVVPHTATEDHGLWDLTGDYGQTPANPPGFGPGEVRERHFEAGTQHYYCKVHPQQMRGTITVPARLERASSIGTVRSGKKTKVRRLLATWSTLPPAEGQVFDVEVRKGGGAWRAYRTGTRATSASIKTRKGVKWSVRARLRSASTPSAATDWSPPVSRRA
ncbi:MAG TPA: plastocyanin/azurin family copper-binding protein [Thermoleophilaceae bacterium]